MAKAIPHPAACVVVLCDRPGLVLAVSRLPGSPEWGLPGGKAEPGEMLRETATRELYEETGLFGPRALAPLMLLHPERGSVTAVYVAHRRELGGRLVRATPEGDVRWQPWRVLFGPPFGAENREVYRTLVRSRRVPADAGPGHPQTRHRS